MNLTPVTSPKVVKALFPNLIWEITTKSKELYLTFDDGPTPEITNWVLDTLKQFNAKASFFCIGKNIALYPDIFQQIINDDHSIGNHTYNHLKGWKSKTKDYLNNVELCEITFKSQNFKSDKLFRPPYGQITPKQIKALQRLDYKIIMWNVLSIDWDSSISEEKCLNNVITNTNPGSIIVFHDSNKAFQNVKYTLPRVLKYFSEKGYTFKRIPE